MEPLDPGQHEEPASAPTAPEVVTVPVAPLPPSDLIDRAVERAAEKVAEGGRARTARPTHDMVNSGLLIAVLVLIGVLFAVRAGDRRAVLRSNETVRAGVGCLLADLDDHRHTNQFAHDKEADALHIEINQPDVIPLTHDQAQVLKQLCDEFIRAGNISLQQGSYAPGYSAKGGPR
ncbi:MAG TPA: hypothetical protein VFI41_05320 [Gemmatimonadales bacterium]|nr:hypothetical protein [Gemmatimonadales bacterium]